MQNIIVIGCGSIGRRHMRNVKLLYPQAQVIAVHSNPANLECPPEADRLAELDKLNSSISLAIVASPANYHLQHAMACLTLGAPTLIEKPLADNYDDAKAFINRLDDNQQRRLGIGYCLRYLPSARYVKTLLDSGLLGTIYNVHVEVGQYLPYWRPETHYQDSVSANARLGGGALNELSHEIDYLHWLFGIKHVRCATLRTTNELTTDVEQLVDATLALEKGVHGTLHLDVLQKAPRRCCTVIAQNARIEWDLMDNTIIQYDKAGQHQLFDGRDYDKNQIYLDLVENFEQAISTNSSADIDITQGLKVLDIIQQIKKAAQHD